MSIIYDSTGNFPRNFPSRWMGNWLSLPLFEASLPIAAHPFGAPLALRRKRLWCARVRVQRPRALFASQSPGHWQQNRATRVAGRSGVGDPKRGRSLVSALQLLPLLPFFGARRSILTGNGGCSSQCEKGRPPQNKNMQKKPPPNYIISKYHNTNLKLLLLRLIKFKKKINRSVLYLFSFFFLNWCAIIL